MVDQFLNSCVANISMHTNKWQEMNRIQNERFLDLAVQSFDAFVQRNMETLDQVETDVHPYLALAAQSDHNRALVFMQRQLTAVLLERRQCSHTSCSWHQICPISWRSLMREAGHSLCRSYNQSTLYTMQCVYWRTIVRRICIMKIHLLKIVEVTALLRNGDGHALEHSGIACSTLQ